MRVPNCFETGFLPFQLIKKCPMGVGLLVVPLSPIGVESHYDEPPG